MKKKSRKKEQLAAGDSDAGESHSKLKRKNDPGPSPRLRTISDFTVLPVRVRVEIPSDPSSDLAYMHSLYFRRQGQQQRQQKQQQQQQQQKRRGDETASGRTIEIANIPSFATEESLRQVFLECGTVEAVRFGHVASSTSIASSFSVSWTPTIANATDSKVALVVFSTEESVERALAMTEKPRILGVHREPMGVDLWLQEYLNMRPSLTSLQRDVDASMAAFESKEEQERQEMKEKANRPDEDGFVVVSRANRRNRNIGNDGAIATAARKNEIQRLRPKERELVDFYRFQMRRTKRNEIADLRRKFEADKSRIQQLKDARKFRPY